MTSNFRKMLVYKYKSFYTLKVKEKFFSAKLFFKRWFLIYKNVFIQFSCEKYLNFIYIPNVNLKYKIVFFSEVI